MNDLKLCHSDRCDISGKLVVKKFKTRWIISCPTCFASIVTQPECDHKLQPIKLTTSNGSIQIRKFCLKCYYLTPQSEPHSQYDGKELQTRNFADYNDFLQGLYDKEREQIQHYYQELQKKRTEHHQNEYSKYLSSNIWIDKKNKAMERDNYECQICHKKADHVHHLSYVHRGKEYMFELVSLCKSCHLLYHKELTTQNE